MRTDINRFDLATLYVLASVGFAQMFDVQPTFIAAALPDWLRHLVAIVVVLSLQFFAIRSFYIFLRALWAERPHGE